MISKESYSYELLCDSYKGFEFSLKNCKSNNIKQQ